jgi:hypothetical protein
MADSEPLSAREDGRHATRRDEHDYRDNRGASLYVLGAPAHLDGACASDRSYTRASSGSTPRTHYESVQLRFGAHRPRTLHSSARRVRALIFHVRVEPGVGARVAARSELRPATASPPSASSAEYFAIFLAPSLPLANPAQPRNVLIVNLNDWLFILARNLPRPESSVQLK